MHMRTLGPFEVSAIGMGCMPLSMNNDRQYPDRADAVATIHAALDVGVTLLDTADVYAPSWDTIGHNEELAGMRCVRTARRRTAWWWRPRAGSPGVPVSNGAGTARLTT